MKNTPRKWLGILGISACVLCCTLPIIGSVIGVTALVSVGVWLEKVALLFLGLGIAALLMPPLIKLVGSNKKDGSCSTESTDFCATDCTCNSAISKAPQEASYPKP